MFLRMVVLLVPISLGGWCGWLLGSAGGLFGAYFSGLAGAVIGLSIGRKIQRNMDGD